MHIILDTEALRNGLKRVLGVVSRRNSLPILSCVLLRVAGDKLSITASDMDIEAQNEIVIAETKATGTACVDANILSTIAEKTPAAQISLKMKDARLHITAEGSTFKLNTLSPDDFPRMPNDLGSGFDLSGEVLRDLIDTVSFAVSTEETRYYLNGVFLDRDHNVIRTVATDGHRLAYCERQDTSGSFPAGIIPRKTINELSKLLDKAQIANVAITPNKMRFQIDGVTLLSKLIDGTFPDYGRVIPPESGRTLTVHAAELASAIDRLLCVADNKSHGIKFELNEKEMLTLSAKGSNGDATEVLSVEYVGMPLSTGFNGRYVLDVLTKIKSKARIEFADMDSSPATFHDATTAGVKFVVMPMRVA